ncbi:hypothetical protein [Chryseobacterium defluvii]|uniref:Uncharacterized protein n=1 Tax=Chryseobacterium defluvii TaxID=160396 RepID=A0A495SE14_9FLAO|nr:hypothetical protein [Chryseobacterium defluvii]RKS98245.1 hypothetical protein BCF58_2386 [Chryseobacterium defluvii]
MEAITWYNKNFRFVYTPKSDISDLTGWKRFLIGAGAIQNYVGDKNAETVLKSAQNMKTDKKILKFRKCGKIEIYVK